MEKITSKHVNTWADKAHEVAKEKGFWDNKSDKHKARLLMLIVSEMVECLENERKPHPLRADLNYFEAEMDFYKSEPDEKVKAAMFFNKFANIIKDSSEDELADTLIRIFDFARGYNHELSIEWCGVTDGINETADMEEPLPTQLFLSMAQIAMYPLFPRKWYKFEETKLLCESALNKTINNILFICYQREINIAKHIELKMKYNAERPLLNGKRF